MTYTILEANKDHLIGLDIMEVLTEDWHVLDVMHQLLDVLRENAQMKARIEAAAAIEEAFPAFGYPTDYAQAASANEMRAKFRAALGLEGE